MAQGLVIVTSSRKVFNGSRITAFDQATGSEVWSRNLTGTYTFSNAAYDQGKIFVINFDGLLRTLDAATGKALWSVKLPDEGSATSGPTASDGVVYVAGLSGSRLYAINETNGDLEWMQNIPGQGRSSPALSSRSVFISTSCPDAYGFARTGGTPLWDYSAPCDSIYGTTAAYYRSRLYVRGLSTDTDHGVVLGSSFGNMRGSFSSTTIPAFGHGVGFFLDDGTLRAENVTDLSTVWSFTGDGDLSTAPLVVNGVVFEGSTSGRIYARRVKTGHGVWQADVGAAIPHPDEESARLLTGLGAGDGLLVVPAVDRLVAYGSA
jgi:outer membrane protein assembly factor BamB